MLPHETPLIDRYVAWLETLAPQGVHRVAQFVARDVRYRTPEREGAGVDAAIVIHAALFDGVSALRMKVTDRASGLNGHTAYLRWDRLVTRADGVKYSLSGVSEAMIDMTGKIASIVEYWDGVPPPPAPRGLLARLLKRQG
ncbi:MAG: nuclear transport factor 2 family protein [Alphaproteobacteria bacterium]|nr:nuclear transport factor 2 family protein [Alphaproteobacteria bacterium]USO07481.1 MAG: nuclear transport factor 2 family protein [Rhodospirillales bacterium]